MTIINGTRNEIGIDSDAYPELLQRIDYAPETIYVMGNQSALDLPMLAVTGARRATPYGIACAERFAEIESGRGLCVVTGGALGIDAAAMEAALESGGKCVAVLAHGLDTDAYPDGNAELFQRIVDAGGALVSEQPWGKPALPWMFRARNRIVTGLALCLLVCEAGIPSGSFAAADGALTQGRRVLAVPGKIDETMSGGCNLLIASGAHPIVSDASLADELAAPGM